MKWPSLFVILRRVLTVWLGTHAVFAQSLPPNLPNLPNLPPGMTLPNPGSSRRHSKRPADQQSQVRPPGVPVPAGSPLFQAFQQLGQQTNYRMRMTMNAADPQMAQMMAQMGFAPMETTVAGDTKEVVMRMKMPAMDLPGQVDDWEFRAVARNGRAARLITSPAVPRLLKLGDEKLARQLAEQDRQATRSILQALASGPLGAISAAVTGVSTVLSNITAVNMNRKAHEFYSWQCVPGPGAPPPDRNAPPPLTDLRVLGEQTLEGVPVTSYEFYVLEGGQSHGPLRMHVARDTGLPARIEMSDIRAGGGMHMDYFDFNKAGNIEVPGCLDGK